MVVAPKRVKILAKMASSEIPGVQWNRKRIRKNAIIRIVQVHNLQDIVYIINMWNILCHIIGLPHYWKIGDFSYLLVIQLCTDFGSCSETCGGGTQTCENSCQNGVFGDTGCPLESKTNSQECNIPDCPGMFKLFILEGCYFLITFLEMSCFTLCFSDCSVYRFQYMFWNLRRW